MWKHLRVLEIEQFREGTEQFGSPVRSLLDFRQSINSVLCPLSQFSSD